MRQHDGQAPTEDEERSGNWLEEQDIGGTVDGLGNVSSGAGSGIHHRPAARPL
jgi:hypothetical protein